MTTNQADREIVISRVFDAPRELVWNAMTDPLQVVKWWGPRGFTTTIEEMDVRPGGTWKLMMHGPDGTDYPNKSIFKEVTKPERLVYSHGGGAKGKPGANFEATWTFEAETDGRTKLTMQMVFPTKEDRDLVVQTYGAIEGGKQTLARLGEELAKTPLIVERTFSAPKDMVWKAITESKQMNEWYFDVDDFQPVVGSETRAVVTKNGKEIPHLWKVIEVITGEKIAYTWKYEGYPGDSIVTFELFSEGDKTRLKLTHVGLESFQPENNPDLACGNFVKGWNYLIGTCLPEHLEKLATADRAFEISRVFDAPRELVWKAWTEARHMQEWWGPRTFTNPVCELDVKPGGKFRIVMRAPDGTEYPATGVYEDIVEPQRLVMVMDHSELPEDWHDMVNPERDKTKRPVLECVQTITLEETGRKTKVTMRAVFESAAVRDAMLKIGMNEGWSGSLERLKEKLSTLNSEKGDR